MKISQDMIDAALDAYSACTNDLDGLHRPSMTRALEAALRVRKARKKAKREKAADNTKPEQDAASVEKFLADLPYWCHKFLKREYQRTPKPLTIQAGKDYMTRDGRKASHISVCGYGRRFGYVEDLPRTWDFRGVYFDENARNLDLISEWQE